MFEVYYPECRNKKKLNLSKKETLPANSESLPVNDIDTRVATLQGEGILLTDPIVGFRDDEPAMTR